MNGQREAMKRLGAKLCDDCGTLLTGVGDSFLTADLQTGKVLTRFCSEACTKSWREEFAVSENEKK